MVSGKTYSTIGVGDPIITKQKGFLLNHLTHYLENDFYSYELLKIILFENVVVAYIRCVRLYAMRSQILQIEDAMSGSERRSFSSLGMDHLRRGH